MIFIIFIFFCIIAITIRLGDHFTSLISRLMFLELNQAKYAELKGIRDGISNTSSAEYLTAQSNMEAYRIEYMEGYQQFIETFYDTMIFSILFLGNFAEVVQMSIFGILRNKKISYLTSDFKINLFLLVAVLYLGFKLTIQYQVIDIYTPDEITEGNIQHAERIIQDCHDNLLLILGVILAVQVAKVLIVFKASKVFGPLGHILMKMLMQMEKFIIMMTGIVLVFVSCGRIMFYNLEPFSTCISAYIFLFQASLGHFDYDVFNNTTDNSVLYGYIFLTLYLIVSTVTLLNFLIATLTSVYDSLNKISTGLYMREIIQIRNFYEDDPFYSGLIAATPPLNLFLLPVYPFLVKLKSRRLNEVVNIVEFQYAFVIGISIFLVCGLISTPFAYIIRIIRLISSFNKERKVYKKPSSILFADIIIFILFGLVILLVQLLIDCLRFARSCYKCDVKSKYNDESNLASETNDKIEPEFLFMFISFLHHYKIQVIPSKVLLADLSEKLKIIQQIRRLLFQHESNIDGHNPEILNKSGSFRTYNPNNFCEDPKSDFKGLYSHEQLDYQVDRLLSSNSPTKILKQFNILKLIVNNNSIPNVSFVQKSEDLRNGQNGGKILLDQNWHKRISSLHRKKQQETKEPKLLSVFYVKDYLSTFEEFHYFEEFKAQIDEKACACKPKDPSSKKLKQHISCIPSHNDLFLISSKCNYRVLNDFHCTPCQ